MQIIKKHQNHNKLQAANMREKQNVFVLSCTSNMYRAVLEKTTCMLNFVLKIYEKKLRFSNKVDTLVRTVNWTLTSQIAAEAGDINISKLFLARANCSRHCSLVLLLIFVVTTGHRLRVVLYALITRFDRTIASVNLNEEFINLKNTTTTNQLRNCP